MSIREIARQSGFSPSAVSMALRGSHKISAAAKRRIVRCARQLDYQPDPKVGELMAQVRTGRYRRGDACFAVISLYDTPRPWERSPHTARIYEGMTDRAEALGFRLEPLWLRAPGMTPRRFRAILDARGIEGLLCFGSPNHTEELPPEFDQYAIVAIGSSVKTPLHRVISHMFNDMTRALDEIYRRGCRRPGLVLGRNTDRRSEHMFLSSYLGWCDYMSEVASGVPVVRLQGLETEVLAPWLRRHRPDVLVFVHTDYAPKQFATVLREHGLRVPEDIGVVVMHQVLDGTGFSGMQQNQAVMGSRAIELLAARILDHDFGIPMNPRIEMVESRWIDGASLAERPAAVR